MATRDLNLRTVCNELGTVAHKAYVIGVQLGIPKYKLEQLKAGDSFLSGIIDYWLNGNIEGAPLTWEWLIKALRTTHVGEGGLANRISEKYCRTGGANVPEQAAVSYPGTYGASQTASHGSPIVQVPQQPSYDTYVACIPSHNHYKLQLRVDPGSDVELHLHAIANVLVNWKQLIPLLGLNDVDKSDIMHIFDPQEQRVKVLQKWKGKFGSSATYGWLLKSCAETNSHGAAEKIVTLLGGQMGRAPQHSPPGIQQAVHIPVQSPNVPSQATPHTTPQVTTPTRPTQQASSPATRPTQQASSSAMNSSPQVVGVPEEFSKKFTPDQLYLWLLLEANQMPEEDCKIIRSKKIGGVAFKGMLEDNDFDGFGISKIGVYSLKDIKGKIASASSVAGLDSPMPAKAAGKNQSSGTHDAAGILDKDITQPKLNQRPWKKNGVEKNLSLKVEMSGKWREIGQNVEIGDAKLKNFASMHQGDNEMCMNNVITEWIDVTSKKYPATWGGLIKLLKSVELNNLASLIEEAANDRESTLYKD